ncbi:retrovirus-related pol polyprotein from type-1 retrotransposable element r1 [Plakobranchus ocellatus]|uniref:Retrovirus-related pol polyprotein from type-1 retrotransposable element r1 n=1 Tax=Plakobranchus ocellatus TaxID=259542 RepID=A0AAV3YZV9_9GAST|nr:retrovirus-related pol polyprotein from type-1 retrotransposable element r1 [Plakobranchus ocellatus]
MGLVIDDQAQLHLNFPCGARGRIGSTVVAAGRKRRPRQVVAYGLPLVQDKCGFRKDHSTLDHLVRLETFTKKAFARKKQVLAVFFDLEKAYDTTWRYGISKDLFDFYFRGRLPIFISNFLKDRHFKVKAENTFSSPYHQENGVPQGSILSPILFNLKINNIIKSVSKHVNASLFVHDFAIYAEGKHLQHLERTIQLCINNVQKWVSENGFRFSVSKTTCVHFHRQRIYAEPALHLDGQPIPVKGEAKFLGVVFDSKLNFSSHVKYLKKKCLKALNLLRVVGHTDWGADRATLLKLYRTLVRSKLDYGSVIYGSAKKHVLRALDPIHHQGLRIALGAFRTTPIKSLYAEAGEPSLEHRRMKLAFNYVLKLKSLPRIPCHEVVFEAPLSDFSAVTKSESNLVANTFEHFKNANISLNIIDNLHVQCPPPWEEHNITVDISLRKQNKENTSEIAYQKEFFRIKEKFSNHYAVFTDGSKLEEKDAAAVYFPEHPDRSKATRLRDGASVFSAELEGIALGSQKLKNSLNTTKTLLSTVTACRPYRLSKAKISKYSGNLIIRSTWEWTKTSDYKTSNC